MKHKLRVSEASWAVNDGELDEGIVLREPVVRGIVCRWRDRWISVVDEACVSMEME